MLGGDAKLEGSPVESRDTVFYIRGNQRELDRHKTQAFIC